MTNPGEIESELTRFLRDDMRAPPGALEPGAALFSSGLLDSFVLVALLAHAEERFGVRLGQGRSMEALDSVRSLARHIAERTRRLVIVTAADAKYFSFLKGMVGSVQAKGPAGAYELCVLDLGLTSDQRTWVEDTVDHVADGRWDVEFPLRNKAPRHVQGLTCRPFLPDYFPGADVYLWMDADAWVQDWAAVELFADAASDGSIAVAPEVDRAYQCHYDQGHAQRWWHGRYDEAFGRHTANRLWRHPGICAGVFALEVDSAGWGVWASYLRRGLERTVDCIDQTSLAVAIYERALPAVFLSAEAHWITTYGLPRLDRKSGLLTHPMPPHGVLGIIHLVGATAKAGPAELATNDGTAVTRWLTWDGSAID